MGTIRILDREVADIIAAGEVVETPASLVKELVENSLDAQAKKISVVVENNCRNIKVSDDGVGMSLEDLEICAHRHATSKISKKEDLFRISTYGFRGEALSSIAAVSRMAISSKQEEAYRILIEAGEVVGQELTNLPRGTEVRVEDLFFNVPARLKFMRTPEGEYTRIKDVILKEALANPNVSFELKIDGAVKMKTTGNGIENTILELFNVNVLRDLNKFSLGFLGNSSLQKSSRDYLFTYFNGRYAKSAVVDKAIVDSYHTRLDKGKYPFVLLFLEVDPGEMDVNVHPSKKIVRFTNEAAMYKVVKNKVSEALDVLDRVIVSNTIVPRMESTPKIEPLIMPSTIMPSTTPKMQHKIQAPSFVSRVKEEYTPKVLPVQEKILQDVKEEDHFIQNRFVGQLYRTFSVVECKDKIEIYDNHIVQERVLYEEIKENTKLSSQALLVPIRVSLSRSDKDTVLKNLEFFSSFNFLVEDFEGNDVVIRSVPVFKFFDSHESVFKELVEVLVNGRLDFQDIREKSIAMMACKGSVRAGDVISDSEMKALINKLHKIGRYTCPHGRNIVTDIPKDFLESKFKR